MKEIPVVNQTMELAQCRGAWMLDEAHDCWCLEDVLSTPLATAPKFQRLSIFVPRAYLLSDGTVDPEGRAGSYTARTAPIVFENNSAGYMQMPHTWLGGPRCYAEPYLAHGLVYVTCGCRGRESHDERGNAVGKSPMPLIDLKTAIRFLRHNRGALPGNFERIVSVGWSAGGAMSALLAVSGDHGALTPYLAENGAFLEESDAVYAAQIYCPIVDLEHADMAYEWMFGADETCEDSPAGPAETMTPFKKALSAELAAQYVPYVNGLGLRDPQTGERLTLGQDGRNGSFYDFLMARLSDSATDFLRRLEVGALPLACSVQDYLDGNYTEDMPAPPPAEPPAGGANRPPRPMALGDLFSRPPRGTPFVDMQPPMVAVPGDDKHAWLSWDGTRAVVCDLDAYVLAHRRRMKPCTAFDKLGKDSGENEFFGKTGEEHVHFSMDVAQALRTVARQFPRDAAPLEAAWTACEGDEELSTKLRLVNPLRYLACGEESRRARHYRIRVGARDADTSLSVSVILALLLSDAGVGTVDYAMVWDQPHSEADYPGEVLAWIDGICL